MVNVRRNKFKQLQAHAYDQRNLNRKRVRLTDLRGVINRGIPISLAIWPLLATLTIYISICSCASIPVLKSRHPSLEKRIEKVKEKVQEIEGRNIEEVEDES